jgi:hypothetical protein
LSGGGWWPGDPSRPLTLAIRVSEKPVLTLAPSAVARASRNVEKISPPPERQVKLAAHA